MTAKNLTPEWELHRGVHDRMPNRWNTGDRAQLRAEIDAYVTRLYGLSRDDFAYILDTFPALKRKKEKAFGEFMSKRKCLEEYDRKKIMMNSSHLKRGWLIISSTAALQQSSRRSISKTWTANPSWLWRYFPAFRNPFILNQRQTDRDVRTNRFRKPTCLGRNAGISGA